MALNLVGLAPSPERGREGFAVKLYIDGKHPEVSDVPTPKGVIRIGETRVFTSPESNREETEWRISAPPRVAWQIATDFARAKDVNPAPHVRYLLALS